MHRLTREVRFALNDGQGALAGEPTNSYAGFPSINGLAHYFALAVTVAGEIDSASSYLLNIKHVDQKVRERGIPLIGRAVAERRFSSAILLELFDSLKDAWTPVRVDALRLSLSPFLSLTLNATEHPMIRLSQKFEFSASHRLHNPSLSDEDNRRMYGKCSNPHGHGHNYELQVTLKGAANESGLLVDVPAFERTVATTVIDRFDHKNLNVQVPEFAQLIPSVENIAMVIYRLLKPAFASQSATLASVTVWETPKTWCEYSE